MKYFTPELYLQGNSPDEDLVDQAEQEWERASKRYRRHYRRIEPQLPESLRKFHDECCLHDADVFGPARLSLQTLPWSFCDVVLTVQNLNTLDPRHLHTLMFLQYGVRTEPQIRVPVPSKLFSREQSIWLYDEIDLVEPGVYSHDIFLSNGQVLHLEFREFRFQIAPLLALPPYKQVQRSTSSQITSA